MSPIVVNWVEALPAGELPGVIRLEYLWMEEQYEEGSPRTEPLRVLIADGDARVRHAFRALLEAEPDIVVVAECSCEREVMESIEASDPSVVILDVCLPDEDRGFRLLGQIAPDGRRSVVAVSVRGGLRSAALAAGARAFVEKGA